MKIRLIGAIVFAVATLGIAQQPVGPAAPLTQKDVVLEAASSQIGNALFLRCFCAENNLSFDAQGKPLGMGKTVDWTLSGVNVLKVERRPGAIEMEAVRVAVRYAPDRHEWERHPQAIEKMKITIADSGDAMAFRKALGKVFAVGIDVALQRSLPDYWRHYFEPSLEWPKDELTGAKALPMNGLLPAGAKEAQVTKKAEASYTAEAERDKVAGTVALRLFVTTEGLAKRVSIAQPLGYGLDERAVEATDKLRFTPTTLADGTAENSYVVLRQEFVVVGR